MLIFSLFRKRSRETCDGDGSEEFFPLSKRINSLQISGEFTFLSSSSNPENLYLSDSSVSSGDQIQLQHNTNGMSQVTSYNPELSLEQNPHYYNQNKDLYELYLLRQLRKQNV